VVKLRHSSDVYLTTLRGSLELRSIMTPLRLAISTHSFEAQYVDRRHCGCTRRIAALNLI
jgi:hypothetical protein